jgi:hypothetical protein
MAVTNNIRRRIPKGKEAQLFPLLLGLRSRAISRLAHPVRAKPETALPRLSISIINLHAGLFPCILDL